MLKYNHYLKELGIKETDFPFASEDIDERYEEDEEGFRSSEFWSLDYTFALYIYSHLCYFRDYCLVGFPMGMNEEEWAKIIDKMIKAFRLYIEKDGNLSKNKQKQIIYGMRLFIKYFHHLWY